MQSKKHSHYEILTNQIVGVIIGWLIVFLLFPFFSHLDQFWIATISTALFFISSYVRSYCIRRIFNGMAKR
jgi:uncharacterized membrane protein YccC